MTIMTSTASLTVDEDVVESPSPISIFCIKIHRLSFFSVLSCRTKVTVGGSPTGRFVMELFTDMMPRNMDFGATTDGVVCVVSDMRALRSLYTQNHNLNLNLSTHRFASRSSFIQNPEFFSHFRQADGRTIHSNNHRQAKEPSGVVVGGPNNWNSSSSWDNKTGPRSEKNPSVYTAYDPVSGRVVTSRGIKNEQELESSNTEENHPSSSSSDYGGVRKANSIGGSGQVFGIGDIVCNKKKGKSKIHWVCSSCGHSDGQWWGTCRACNSVGTIKQFSEGEFGGGKTSGFEVSENVMRSWLPQQSTEAVPLRLTDVNRGINQLDWRIPLYGLFGTEVARVLGGGLVPGSLVLVGGDPGVGKSTLLLQIAAMIAEGHDFGQPAPVVYVSGEESVEQIGNRADRMSIGTEELYLYSSTDIEDILGKVQLLSPRALIVDSIQTVYLRGVTGSAGGLSQVKECTSALLRFAKKTNIPVLLIGHVTKSGDIAGPRVLEHIVDVVLYMEGEKYSSHRLLRSVKNRFGSTDELGVFEMSQSGLQAVSNPSEMFLSEQHSDSEFLAGLAVAAIMDGSRTFLIEIQALCVAGSSTSRQVNGVQASRADMIISVLIKQAGLKLQENGIFLNVVSGVTLTETAGDLAIAAAICSSFLEFPIPNSVAFIGEIGLGGELRTVPRMEKRVNTVAKLGYKKCVVPKSAEKSLSALGLEEMKILGCRNLKEVINTVFTMD
uniref:RecA family profile 1 domain-containing protein n=1 Tax=Davidia involucrata TaxID=16924 RepID=A0A5B6YQ16_DAVIN